MKNKKYDKLVRDKIPQIIEENSKTYSIKMVKGAEKLDYLLKKLFEEVGELNESRNIEELADVQEVVNSIGKELGISKKDLEEIRKEKNKTRGSFDKGVVLLEVIEKQ